MFWNIFAKEVQMPKGEESFGGDPAIELSWGWTACLSDEEVENLSDADDVPKGKDSVLTTLSMAKELRHRLDEIIARHE